jgi:glucose/arabinose dehydrogenase
MKRARKAVFLTLGLTAAAGAVTVLLAGPPRAVVRLDRVAGGFDAPVHATHAGDGTGRLFVVEQPGRIQVLGKDGQKRVFLDIVKKVRSGGEMGLLSVAFHPRYRENGRFFVDYTRAAGRRKLETVIAEYRASKEDPDVAVDEERVLLTIDQPYPNHNGGQLAFGADGCLYIGMGDGGAANDPLNSGQDLGSLLGKLLRIGVDGAQPYEVPKDNPFVGRQGVRPEVWAWGLRNPWRFSFDREKPERLFAGDVGQNKWEEVHLIRKGDNCGWRVMEGTHDFMVPDGFDRSTLAAPIHDYPRKDGMSVTGGFLYRGKGCPSLRGKYVFADFYPGALWALTEQDGRWTRSTIGRHEFPLSSFGEDEAGELLVCDHGGVLYRLVEPQAAGPF